MLVKEKEAHGMSFTVKNRAGRRILVALLAAAGFAAGIWTGVAGTHPAAACHQQDLSPVPVSSTIAQENTSTTQVRTAVATVESVRRIPHLARMAVMPAKKAEPNA